MAGPPLRLGARRGENTAPYLATWVDQFRIAEVKTMPVMKISKLDAARRQLDTAIEMFFLEREPVSICTLGGAALQIMKDLNKHRGGDPMLSDLESLKQFVIPGKEKEVHQLLVSAENFFKHADRDPNEAIDFRPEGNIFVLWEAALKYVQLSGEQTHNTYAILVWFQIRHPTVFKHDPAFQQKIRAAQELGSLSRGEFYRLVIEARLNFGVQRR
jgi:hypothetical protein